MYENVPHISVHASCTSPNCRWRCLHSLRNYSENSSCFWADGRQPKNTKSRWTVFTSPRGSYRRFRLRVDRAGTSNEMFSRRSGHWAVQFGSEDHFLERCAGCAERRGRWFWSGSRGLDRKEMVRFWKRRNDAGLGTGLNRLVKTMA